MAGTLVLTDTIKQSYDDLAGSVYKDTDAVVQSATSVEPTNKTGLAARIDAARARPGSQRARRRRGRAASARCRVGRRSRRRPARQQPQPRDPDRAWHGRPTSGSTRCSSSTARTVAANEIVIDRRLGRQGQLRGRRHHPRRRPERDRPSTGSPASRRTPARTTRPARRSSRSTPETATKVLGQPGRYDAIDVVAAARRVADASSSPNSIDGRIAQPRASRSSPVPQATAEARAAQRERSSRS